MHDLTSVLEELGITVTAVTAARVHGLCPMHAIIKGRADSKPSWSIDQDLLVHHCFSCGYKGTLRGLVADLQGVDQGEAAGWLRSYGLLWAEKQLKARGRRPVAAERPTALESLLKGFCDPPDSALEKRQLERFAVEHYGVRWDPVERGWITPIRRETGELMGYQFKRRHKVRNRPDGVKKRQTLFGIEKFPDGGRAILVESPLDVVRLYSEGIVGGLSSFGVLVDAIQLDLILAHADELVLALDNDDDGRLQRDVLLQRLWYSPLKLWVLDYTGSSAKDIGEMSGEEIQQRLTTPLWKFDVAVADNVFHL